VHVIANSYGWLLILFNAKNMVEALYLIIADSMIVLLFSLIQVRRGFHAPRALSCMYLFVFLFPAAHWGKRS
jgi:hypothetical protein